MTNTDFNQIREEFKARFKPDKTAEIAELENALVSLDLSIASHRDSFQRIEKEEKKLLIQFKDTDVVANPDQIPIKCMSLHSKSVSLRSRNTRSEN